MKTVLNNVLQSLSNKEVKKLTTEVKETLAPGFKNKKSKIFTSAELWNIQRNRKSISINKFYPY